VQLPRQRLHAHDGLQGVAQRARIEAHREAFDHALRFEPPQTFGGARRRKSDAAREFAHGLTRVLGEGGDECAIRFVQRDGRRTCGRRCKAFIHDGLRFIGERAFKPQFQHIYREPESLH
jgi:hypothetical protein